VCSQHQDTLDVAGAAGPLMKERKLGHLPLSFSCTRCKAGPRSGTICFGAPAAVVQGSAVFPRNASIGSLAKYKSPYEDNEPTETLVKKLTQFYADRTLTKSPITPADQAEAYFILVSRRLSKMTGQIITVDGGLPEAFLR
jgi:hypothetical protein